MFKHVVSLSILILVLVRCRPVSDADPSPTPTPASQTPIPSQTFTPAPTSTPTRIPLPTPMPSATVVPTPTWEIAGPGEVEAPILMYHHVDPEKGTGKFSYNIHPDDFANQMQLLADLGYQTITASQLIDAITEGEPLPPRPIVITFDDGHISVYRNAFPIMNQYGFVGVNYVVANRLQAEGFLGVNELQEMLDAGWEVGSHSYTHTDLTLDHSTAYAEIVQSRERIYDALSIKVDTFAYPFGSVDPYLLGRTLKWGYSGAMGLGWSTTHNSKAIHYLHRIEIFGDMSLEDFQAKLPAVD